MEKRKIKFESKKDGFTLIELLVSLTILGIMFMYGLLNMVVLGTGYLITVKHTKNANYLLTKYAEILLNIEYNNFYLEDDGDPADLNDLVNPDYYFPEIERIEGVNYNIAWNISENADRTKKRIKIYVIWKERGKEKRASRVIEKWKK